MAVFRVNVDKFAKSHIHILVFHSPDAQLAVIVRCHSSGVWSSIEFGEPAQRPQAGHEAIFAAAIDDESGQSLEVTADWLIRDSEFTAIATADQRVLFGGCADELAVVCPLPLDELELPVKVRPNKGE